MDVYKKIRRTGLKQALRSVLYRLAIPSNKLLYSVFKAFKLHENLIVFESEGDFSDNSYAFYNYLKNHPKYNQKYRFVWAVEDVRKARVNSHTIVINKKPCFIDFRRSYYLATCKFFIFDHFNLLSEYNKRSETRIINLFHGAGFKASKGDEHVARSPADINFTTGQLFYEGSCQVFHCTRDAILDIGYSRNDYLFAHSKEVEDTIDKILRINKYKKKYLWMPTFRTSKIVSLDEDIFTSQTGLPIIDTVPLLEDFNQYLVDNNSVCVFKLHHLQAELESFNRSYSNIVLLRDEAISEHGLQLYQIVASFDCLITDYSSIATDYMLLNRPIIYTVDDYEEYQKSRGFWLEDPIKYFAGHCVRNAEEFYAAVKEVDSGIDKYDEMRKELLPLYHTHADGKTSERIAKYLGL